MIMKQRCSTAFASYRGRMFCMGRPDHQFHHSRVAIYLWHFQVVQGGTVGGAMSVGYLFAQKSMQCRGGIKNMSKVLLIPQYTNLLLSFNYMFPSIIILIMSFCIMLIKAIQNLSIIISSTGTMISLYLPFLKSVFRQKSTVPFCWWCSSGWSILFILFGK